MASSSNLLQSLYHDNLYLQYKEGKGKNQYYVIANGKETDIIFGNKDRSNSIIGKFIKQKKLPDINSKFLFRIIKLPIQLTQEQKITNQTVIEGEQVQIEQLEPQDGQNNINTNINDTTATTEQTPEGWRRGLRFHSPSKVIFKNSNTTYTIGCYARCISGSGKLCIRVETSKDTFVDLEVFPLSNTWQWYSVDYTPQKINEKTAIVFSNGGTIKGSYAPYGTIDLCGFSVFSNNVSNSNNFLYTTQQMKTIAEVTKIQNRKGTVASFGFLTDIHLPIESNLSVDGYAQCLNGFNRMTKSYKTLQSYFKAKASKYWAFTCFNGDYSKGSIITSKTGEDKPIYTYKYNITNKKDLEATDGRKEDPWIGYLKQKRDYQKINQKIVDYAKSLQGPTVVLAGNHQQMARGGGLFYLAPLLTQVSLGYTYNDKNFSPSVKQINNYANNATYCPIYTQGDARVVDNNNAYFNHAEINAVLKNGNRNVKPQNGNQYVHYIIKDYKDPTTDTNPSTKKIGFIFISGPGCPTGNVDRQWNSMQLTFGSKKKKFNKRTKEINKTLENNIVVLKDKTDQTIEKQASSIFNKPMYIQDYQLARQTTYDEIDAILSGNSTCSNWILFSHWAMNSKGTLQTGARLIVEHIEKSTKGSGKNRVVAWITGHSHLDSVTPNLGPNKSTTLVACLQSAFRLAKEANNESQDGITYYNYDKYGTPQQSDFNIFTLNVIQKKLYCTRFGLGKSKTISIKINI